MSRASSSSIDANAVATSDPVSPIVQTPISSVSPPSPAKLKKKPSTKRKESDDKHTLKRAISLSTSAIVEPVLNASGSPPPPHHSKRRVLSGPKSHTRTTPTKNGSTTAATTAQKPKEKTPPIQDAPSPFAGQGQLVKPITQVDAEPRAKPASPTRQLSYAAVTAKSIPNESLASKPMGTTRGKAQKLEGPSQRQQPYGRQHAHHSHPQIQCRPFTPEEKQTWDQHRRSIEHDKAHLSWLDNDAGNTDTARLAVLMRIIEYREKYGSMPMEVTYKTAATAKGGVEKVVCGPCRQEGRASPKEYPTVQKAAVHITSNHWEMHLWLCTIPGCTKVFRCRDGIQNPKRHMEKAHPDVRQSNNPNPSIHLANSAEPSYHGGPSSYAESAYGTNNPNPSSYLPNPTEPSYLAVPSNYAESASGTEYSFASTFAPSVGSQYSAKESYASPTSYQGGYHGTEQGYQPIPHQSNSVYVQASQAKGKGRAAANTLPAPLKLHPPLMPIAPAPLPDPYSSVSSASPSRSQGPMSELLGKLGGVFGFPTTTTPVQPTIAQSVAMMGNKVAFGSISPSEMPNVVPAAVPKPPVRRATADTRPTPTTGMTMMMNQTSLGVGPQGRARNVSNPTTMYTAAPFQIPASSSVPSAQSIQTAYSQAHQQVYAQSSHTASLSPQHTSPLYAPSMGYEQTPESYTGSSPQRMSMSPYSQGHHHFAYPSPASFGASPPYAGTGPPLSGVAKMTGPTNYLSPQVSGQHSPNPSSRSSLSSPPFPPTDDPLLGYDYSQGGQRISIGSETGAGQSLEYVNVSGQPPLSSPSEYTQYQSPGNQLPLGAMPLGDVSAYSHAPPSQKPLSMPNGALSDSEEKELKEYFENMTSG